MNFIAYGAFGGITEQQPGAVGVVIGDTARSHQWWNCRNRARIRLMFHYDGVITVVSFKWWPQAAILVSLLAGVLGTLQCPIFCVYRVALDHHLGVQEDRCGFCPLFLIE
jgi:hypothetical protein